MLIFFKLQKSKKLRKSCFHIRKIKIAAKHPSLSVALEPSEAETHEKEPKIRAELNRGCTANSFRGNVHLARSSIFVLLNTVKLPFNMPITPLTLPNRPEI